MENMKKVKHSGYKQTNTNDCNTILETIMPLQIVYHDPLRLLKRDP